MEQQKRGIPSFQTRQELALELVHATEAAALACARMLGKGDPDRVSEIAGEAMRRVLEDSGLSGTVMLGPRSDPNLAHGTSLSGGERMVDFGAALPRLRLRLRRDLVLSGLPREKVLAVLVSLLDATRVRIGNAEYARDNNSFGLTTLRNRHVQFVRDGKLLFRFRGKGGAEHEIAVDDRRLAHLVRKCHQLPGQRLFQYLDDAGERHPVDSDQVNAYLRDAMGADFTAKDFRTWGATLRAIALMSATPLPESASERELNACIVAAIKRVATELRNTPAVCRKSYINPLVFSAWRSGALHRAVSEDISAAPRKAEKLALVFLRQQAREVKRAASKKQVPLEKSLRDSISRHRRAGRIVRPAPRAAHIPA